VNVAQTALAVALPVGLLGLISLVIASVNSRRGSSIGPTSSDGAQSQKIGFPIRGVGFFMSQKDEIDNYAYAWPYVAKLCLVVSLVALVIAFVAWITS
jgi:hypothetical protein